MRHFLVFISNLSNGEERTLTIARSLVTIGNRDSDVVIDSASDFKVFFAVDPNGKVWGRRVGAKSGHLVRLDDRKDRAAFVGWGYSVRVVSLVAGAL